MPSLPAKQAQAGVGYLPGYQPKSTEMGLGPESTLCQRGCAMLAAGPVTSVSSLAAWRSLSPGLRASGAWDNALGVPCGRGCRFPAKNWIGLP